MDAGSSRPVGRDAGHEERRLDPLHRRCPRSEIFARSIRSTPPTSTSWRWRGASRPTTSVPRPEFKLEGTPLAINGALYTTAGTRRSVVALDGAHRRTDLGAQLSRRQPRGERAATALGPRRLVLDRRQRRRADPVRHAPAIASSSSTRRPVEPVQSFGNDGIVDLKDGAVFGNGQPIDLETGEIGLHATPTVVKDVVIVGSSFKEGTQVVTHNNTKGLVRAFDVRTGKLLWTFNTIPRPGEFGNDTWENDSWAVNGNTGVWTQITVDEELGPRLSAGRRSHLRSVRRPSSRQQSVRRQLVCVDLKTGQRKWHFQVVHHPIWDYDLSSAPILADITVERPRDQGGRAAEQGIVPLRVRSRHRPAGVADRRAAGAAVATCPARRRRRRSRSRPSRRRTRARRSRSGRTDRLHAGAARGGAREREEVPHGPDVPAAGGRARSTGRSARSRSARSAAARTGRARRTIPRRTRSTRRRRTPASSLLGLVEPPQGFSDIRYVAGHRRPAVPDERRSGLRQRGRRAQVSASSADAAARRRQTPRSCRPAAAGAARRPRRAGGRRRGGLHVQGLPIVKPPYGVLVGDQSRSRRARMAGAARRHAGQRPQSPGAARA